MNVSFAMQNFQAIKQLICGFSHLLLLNGVGCKVDKLVQIVLPQLHHDIDVEFVLYNLMDLQDVVVSR